MRKSDQSFSPAALAARLFVAGRTSPGVRFRVAYSGGLDSHVLLHALAALRDSQDINLRAVHVDHCLHPDSEAWSAHCAQVCTSLAVPFELRRVAVTGRTEEGLEAAARRARYTVLADLLEPGEILLTAHHLDDQAETVLLQLLRGSGLAGLAAMPLCSVFGPGELLRPLLGFSRAALRAYALAHSLEWLEDPSNRDYRLRRNFVRAEIMPRLQTHWPGVNAMFARSAGHAAEAMQLLDEIAQSDLQSCQHADAARHPNALSVPALMALTAARRGNLLRHWLKQQGYLAPGSRQLAAVSARVETSTQSRHACVSWPGVQVWRYRDLLVALPECPPPDPALDVAWDLRSPLDLPGFGRLSTRPVTGAGLACIRAGERLRVRLRRGGETVLLPGRRHHHALKKLLQAEGVPPWLRPRLPLLYTDGQLAAVADCWVCAPYAARAGESGFEIVWEPFAGNAGKPEKIR